MCGVLFVPERQTFLSHRRGGGQTFLTHRRGGLNFNFGRMVKHFSHTGGEHTFLHNGWGQTFHVVGGGGHDGVDVEKEMYVSKANFLVSKASKLSAGARIFRGL